MGAPKVLIVAIEKSWIGISRLPRALWEAGLKVGVFCPSDSFIAGTKFLDAKFVIGKSTRWRSFYLLYYLYRWKPDIIIPGDESAVVFLQNVITSSSKNLLTKLIWKPYLDLFVRSLGDPSSYKVLNSKHKLHELAVKENIPVPKASIVTGAEDAITKARKIGYPVVLKKEYGFAGSGIIFCDNEEQIYSAYSKLRYKPKIKKKNTLKKYIKGALFPATFRIGSTVIVQRYIKGTPVMHVFVAKQGKILASITALKICTNPPVKGPSSVVRFIKNTDIDDYAATIIRKMEFSGFGSFDFILEEGSGSPYLLECNPRPTPVCHLGKLVGVDLGRAFLSLVTDDEQIEMDRSNNYKEGFTVALFPQELNRDPKSKNVIKHYHDIPQDDPGLLSLFWDNIEAKHPNLRIEFKNKADSRTAKNKDYVSSSR